MPSTTFGSSGTWPVPSDADPSSIGVYAWGESGTAGTSAHGSHSGGGSGPGAFAGEPALGGLVPGTTTLVITIGAGGTGTNTTVTGGSVTVQANAGTSASGQTAGTPGAAGSNTIAFAGGAAAAGLSGATQTGAGGGGSAGSTGAGGAASSGTGGAAGTGAAGPPSLAGAAGQSGAGTTANGANGTAPGGGASGGGSGGATNHTGGSGAPGQVVIIWSLISARVAGTVSGTGIVSAVKKAIAQVKGVVSATGPSAEINQWAGSFSQPASFGTMPPALQSVVVPLTPSSSVGRGTGTPSQGTWLFCVIGMSETSAAAGFTVGVSDDIHSFWRPVQVSPSAALTRTSVWYTANTARQPGFVYVSPNGPFDGLSVLVIEEPSLGPWDEVTGAYADYAAAATSLALSLAAPSAQAFLLGAAAGDLDTAGQAFAPAGWTPLATVTTTNGTDHTADCVLTSACLTTSGSVSVSASASSDTDLSGVVIGVLTNAPSPIQGGSNPAWPWLIAEMASGSGFPAPDDEREWTQVTKRLWSWRENFTGIQYNLGALQASDADIQLDNWDGAFSPSNPGSFYYSNALNLNMSFNMAYPNAGITPWSASNGATLSQSSAQAFASAPNAVATYSLEVTPNGSTATPGAQSERFPVTAGSVYSASAWFWYGAVWATGAQVAISWWNSGGTLISTSTVTATAIPAQAWTQVTQLAVTAPAGAVHATILPQSAGIPPASPPFYVAEAALAAGSAAVSTGLVNTGTPVRLRMALGTIGGVTVNRWYTWARNAYKWPEQRNQALRGFVPAKLTDVWTTAAAGSCPTPYRGEAEQDLAAYGPGWWWPCDDQPLTGGVLPASLRNAAKGRSTVLNIVASPSGVSAQDTYSSGLTPTTGAGGVDLTAIGGASAPGPSVATYAVAQSAGWMYGDPQVSVQSSQSGNPVTAQPGSAAWQQSGLLGDTGSAGWTLIANDTFPALSTGLSVTGWFNYGFLGTSTSFDDVSLAYYNLAGQPYCPLTLFELATNSAPVAILQLDISGHLNLITYNGGTGTSHSIYTASDLRCNAFIRATVELTNSTYTVYLNGSLSASASGSCTISASAASWFIVNGDLGSNGGSSAGTGLQHGGNVQVSHLKIYAGLLPLHRELAQYSAAVTGCGLLPPPSSVAASTAGSFDPTGAVPDGSEYDGSYGASLSTFSLSAVAVSAAGSYTSGPAARTVVAGRGGSTSGNDYGLATWISWTAVAPLVQLYTSASADTETGASSVLGSGESYTSGFGSGASGHGVGHVSGGTGASPPAAPSALGDTVQQRIERALGYGACTYPNRAIDAASLLVQAALDVGGQPAGQTCINIALSDDGMLLIDNNGTLSYRDRPHLASDTAAWQLGPNVSAGQVPYTADQSFGNDPVRVWNSIAISPYSPDGSSLADITPSDATAVAASQAQYGVRPLPSATSYLQSTTEIQNSANWLFSEYGTLRRRVEKLTVKAGGHPAAWVFVLGANCSDLVEVFDQPVSGAPASKGLYRITQITGRTIAFGANGNSVTGEITVLADFEPSNYWT